MVVSERCELYAIEREKMFRSQVSSYNGSGTSIWIFNPALEAPVWLQWWSFILFFLILPSIKYSAVWKCWLADWRGNGKETKRLKIKFKSDFSGTLTLILGQTDLKTFGPWMKTGNCLIYVRNMVNQKKMPLSGCNCGWEYSSKIIDYKSLNEADSWNIRAYRPSWNKKASWNLDSSWSLCALIT